MRFGREKETRETRREGERERERVKKKKVDPRDLFLSSLRTFFENGGRGSSASAKQLQATSSWALDVGKNDNEIVWKRDTCHLFLFVLQYFTVFLQYSSTVFSIISIMFLWRDDGREDSRVKKIFPVDNRAQWDCYRSLASRQHFDGLRDTIDIDCDIDIREANIICKTKLDAS